MQLTDSPAAEAFRVEVREFLSTHLPDDWTGPGSLDHGQLRTFEVEWRKKMHDAGLLGLTWPVEVGGRGLSAVEDIVLHEEFARVAAPLGIPSDIFGIHMVGPTLLHRGTEAQQHHFLPRILSGEHRWCQGYSEPGAGSDLAGLSCRARLEGDEWIIDGQKVWTSYGHLADWIFVLARTEDAGSKHRGITFFLVPMDQVGIDVRPIRMLSGDSEFNEVFFTGARCPVDHVVGEPGEGWRVAMSLLGHERGQEAATAHIRYREELQRLLVFVRENRLQNNPIVRQRLAECHMRVEVMRFLGLRALMRFLDHEPPGPDAAIFKLYWSEYHRSVTELAVDLLGADALVPSGRWPSSVAGPDDAGAPNTSASWVGTFYNARAGTIYSGTSEIQRTIIGESVLGLPREPRPPSDPGGQP